MALVVHLLIRPCYLGTCSVNFGPIGCRWHNKQSHDRLPILPMSWTCASLMKICPISLPEWRVFAWSVYVITWYISYIEHIVQYYFFIHGHYYNATPLLRAGLTDGGHTPADPLVRHRP